MANNPQTEQDKIKREKSEQGRVSPEKSQEERSAQREQQAGNPRDDSMVGRDTDGDGKVVKPGQKPGQSHGQGLPENKPGYDAGKKH